MANNRYSELATDRGFPSTKGMTQQGDEGQPSKVTGEISGQRGKKDPGGDMPMRFGTASWKMPGGYREQPRDRSFGMREADGYAMCEGLGKTGYHDESDETYVKRGNTGKSR